MAIVSPLPVNGWHRTRVTVTLLAEDSRSGVAHTLYRVDSGAWQTYTAPISVTAQGTTTIAYRSVDLVDNVEATHTATVKLDSIPPTTTAKVYTDTATVALLAADDTLRVAHTAYRVDAGDWQTYTAPITVSTGVTTTVRFYSVDVAGNVEAERTEIVYLEGPEPDRRIYLPLLLRNY